MEITLPENHPDLKRIVEAAHHDIAAKSDKGNSLANALSAALGKAPGCDEDLENIEFLIHVLSVNRAAGGLSTTMLSSNYFSTLKPVTAVPIWQIVSLRNLKPNTAMKKKLER